MDLESKKLEIEILEKKLELARLQEKQKIEINENKPEIAPKIAQPNAALKQKPIEPLRSVRRGSLFNENEEIKKAKNAFLSRLPKAETVQIVIITIIGFMLMVTFENWTSTIATIFCLFLSFIIINFVFKLYKNTKSNTILFGGGLIALCVITIIWGAHQGKFSEQVPIITTQESMIKKQFNPWDGSHIALTSIIKSRLHDPSSFEQDETKYWTMSDHISVIQTYRAKNGFGAIRKQTAKAKFDFSGNLMGEVETL